MTASDLAYLRILTRKLHRPRRSGFEQGVLASMACRRGFFGTCDKDYRERLEYQSLVMMLGRDVGLSSISSSTWSGWSAAENHVLAKGLPSDILKLESGMRHSRARLLACSPSFRADHHPTSTKIDRGNGDNDRFHQGRLVLFGRPKQIVDDSAATLDHDACDVLLRGEHMEYVRPLQS